MREQQGKQMSKAREESGVPSWVRRFLVIYQSGSRSESFRLLDFIVRLYEESPDDLNFGAKPETDALILK